jgi:tetratricopeptide (TPR) repeat protein
MNRLIQLLFLLFFIGCLYGQSDNESDDFSYPLKLYNQGFYDLSARQFTKFYHKYPASRRSAEAKFYTAMSYYQLKNWEKARVEFQTLALENPENHKAAESWYKAGECYQKLNQKLDAAKSFATIRLLYPENPLAVKALYQAAFIYQTNGNINKAKELFWVVIDRYSESDFYALSLIKMAGIYQAETENHKARAHINKALSVSQNKEIKAEALMIFADIYISEGQLNLAADQYHIILKEYMNSKFYTAAALKLGKLYLSESQYVKAQNILLKGQKKAKTKALVSKFNEALGDAYLLGDNFSGAYQYYTAAATDSSVESYLFIQLKSAIALKKQNNLSKALQLLERTLSERLNKSSAVIQKMEAVYLEWLVLQKDYDKAIEKLYFKLEKIQFLKDKIETSFQLVELLALSGKWRAIIRELEPFLNLNENYQQQDELYYYLAYASEKLKKYDDAEFYYTTLIDQFSASSHKEFAREHLTYLRKFKIIRKDKAVYKTLNLISSMLESGNKGFIQFQLGDIYRQDLKDYDQALKNYHLALKNSPPNLGDLEVTIGKSYLELSEKYFTDTILVDQYVNLASENLKKALAAKEQLSKPDEASWLLIQTKTILNALSADKIKQYVETLISQYPQSPLLEEWYEALAFNLAFEPEYHQESLNYFKRLITHYKGSEKYPSYLMHLSKMLADTAAVESRDYLKQIALDYPNSAEAAEALYQLASFFFETKNYEDSHQLFNRLYKDHYYSKYVKQAQKKIANIELKSGNYTSAIARLEKKIKTPFLNDIVLMRELLPQNTPENIYFLAKGYEQSGDKQKALKYYHIFLKTNKESDLIKKAKLNIAILYYETGKTKQSLPYFESIAESDLSLFLTASKYKGQLYFEHKQYNDAAKNYRKISQLIAPSDETFRLVKGREIISLIRAGNLTESKTLIENFQDHFPDDEVSIAQFMLEIGKYYRSQKNYDKAKKYLSEVKDDYSKSGYMDDADYFLSLIYITLNKNEEAYEILSDFYAKYPNSNYVPDAFNTLGGIYFRSEKYDDAIRMFKNALEICTNSELEQNIISNLIKAYTYTGFWDAAQASARIYVEKFPTAKDRISKKIIIGRSYISLNQFQSGVDYLKKIKMESDSETEPEIQFYIGEAYLKAGQYENAIAEFVKIPLLSKKTKLQWEASALYYSGQAYEKLGRTNDAVRMYEEIVQRPGIESALKNEARKRIKLIKP